MIKIRGIIIVSSLIILIIGNLHVDKVKDKVENGIIMVDSLAKNLPIENQTRIDNLHQDIRNLKIIDDKSVKIRHVAISSKERKQILIWGVLNIIAILGIAYLINKYHQ